MCGEVKYIEEDDDSTILVPTDYPSGGTSNYEDLMNKPQINDITLIGNKTSKQLKLQDEMTSLTNMEIERLLGGN